MPTYEYECTKCEKRFELFQPITARPKRTLATDCRKCNGKAPVERCIGTGGGLIFRGSGFYITDYRSESYKQAARSENGVPVGEGPSKSENAGTSKDGNASNAAQPAAKDGKESHGTVSKTGNEDRPRSSASSKSTKPSSKKKA